MKIVRKEEKDPQAKLRINLLNNLERSTIETWKKLIEHFIYYVRNVIYLKTDSASKYKIIEGMSRSYRLMPKNSSRKEIIISLKEYGIIKECLEIIERKEFDNPSLDEKNRELEKLNRLL